MGIWAALLIAVLVLLPYPVAAAIPLLVLVVTFEVIRPLHFGAERIGRYLQVFYEEAGEPGRSLSDTPSWERVAMSFGAVPGVGGHPLFVPVFLMATAAQLSGGAAAAAGRDRNGRDGHPASRVHRLARRHRSRDARATRHRAARDCAS